MRILFLAPQPFYEDRGSPIAVKMVIELLSKRGDFVDLVTYHPGQSIAFDRINHIRTPKISFIRTVRPGFSWQKLVCDLFMLLLAVRLVLIRRYDVIYAVEEAVYFAVLFRFLFKIPYVYDMDSSLVEQMLDKYPALKPISGVLQAFEALAIRNATATVVVCESLYRVAKVSDAAHAVLLYDAPHSSPTPAKTHPIDLRTVFSIKGSIVMYAGNLEYYQGLPLLLESFTCLIQQTSHADLVIVGGEPADIARLSHLAEMLGIHGKVHFLGRVPYNELSGLLQQANLLCSPRIKGSNTPMKIYNYMHSGVAIVATELWTHRQVLDETTARLVKAEPEAFAKAMYDLLVDDHERQRLGAAGKRLLEARYSYDAFAKTFGEFMCWLECRVTVMVPAPEPLEIEIVP